MQRQYVESESECIKKDINLSLKRLDLVLNYIDFQEISFDEKIIIFNFLKEIAYNIYVEIENLSLNVEP